MTKPIRPDEVVGKKIEATPNEVFEAFNEMIAENWDGRESTFTQKAVVGRIRGKLKEDQDLKTSWLNIEDSYREYGWVVEYDKPGYNETYDATFTFKKGRKRG